MTSDLSIDDDILKYAKKMKFIMFGEIEVNSSIQEI